MKKQRKKKQTKKQKRIKKIEVKKREINNKTIKENNKNIIETKNHPEGWFIGDRSRKKYFLNYS